MKPTNKVMAGALAGALAAIAVWGMKQWGHTEVPSDIAIALSTVFSAVVGYFVPDAEA